MSVGGNLVSNFDLILDSLVYKFLRMWLGSHVDATKLSVFNWQAEAIRWIVPTSLESIKLHTIFPLSSIHLCQGFDIPCVSPAIKKTQCAHGFVGFDTEGKETKRPCKELRTLVG